MQFVANLNNYANLKGQDTDYYDLSPAKLFYKTALTYKIQTELYRLK